MIDNNAIETTESNSTKDVYVHEFKEPFEYEGKKYETLTFDFGKLTGKTIILIETEMQALGQYIIAPEISRSFQSKMASRAAENIASDVIEAMPVGDFNKITNAARNFLLNTGIQ